jgi:[acyl-carrier-protein] S-malonyltransferase
MGKNLFDQFPEAKGVFAAADDALGTSLSKLCFEGPDETLRLTENTQPALLAVSAAAHAAMQKRGLVAHYVAGHSLGEYSALVACGALSLADAIRAVRSRGRLMQSAVSPGVGAMAAVLGLAPEKVRAACQEAAQDQVLVPANYNSPEQTVISGHAEAVSRASQKLKEAGAKRVIPLPVSAPFHCSLMEPVKRPLADVLAKCSVRPLGAPVVTNVEAAPNADPARVVPLLIEQVTHPVRWTESVEALVRLGVRRFVEVGPGKVLSGLIKRIDKSVEVLNVEDAQTLEKTARALEAP